MTLVPAPAASPSELETQWKLAQRLCNTDFVPSAFKGKPENILAAMMTGHEHGIGPMQALQSINVIQGKPTLSPELMRALVARAGHRVDTLEYSESIVTLKGARSDTGAEATVTWTMEDAKRAGLTGKGAWKTYPRSMLLARATAELCRLLYPDIIAGLSYTEEELGGEPAVVQVPSTTTAPAPLLPHEIDEPPAPGSPQEQGSGETVPSPEALVPGPAPDLDDEPAEAEIVEPERVVDPETGEIVEGGGVTSEPGETSPAQDVDTAEAANPAGTTEAPASTPDESTWSPGAWRENAAARGVSQRGLIVKAREIAEQNNLDVKVAKLGDLLHPEIAPALRVWLLLQTKGD